MAFNQKKIIYLVTNQQIKQQEVFRYQINFLAGMDSTLVTGHTE